MDYMRELSSFLEEQVSITTSWLANELQISIRKAADLIAQFKESKSDAIASYRLTYRDNMGGLCVTVVKDFEMKSMKENNVEIISSQIYSLSKIDSEGTQTALVDAALAQAEGLLRSTASTHSSFLTNVSGEVHIASVDIRPVGERIFSSQNLALKGLGSLVSSSAPPLPSMVRAPSISSEKENKPQSQQIAAKSQTQSNTLKKAAKTNEEMAKKYFSSFSSVPKVEPEPEMQDRFASGAGDDEEEWGEGTVKLAAKVQRVQPDTILELTEKSSQESNEETSMDIEGEETESTKRTVKKVNPLKRGAMDDYMEDLAIQEYKLNQELAASGAPPVKKTKRVLREKSTIDSDGYFVVEMVYEDVTDDESEFTKKVVEDMKPSMKKTTSENIPKENLPVNETKKETKSEGKQPLKAKAVASTTGKTTGVAQKSMMSFFKKA